MGGTESWQRSRTLRVGSCAFAQRALSVFWQRLLPPSPPAAATALRTPPTEPNVYAVPQEHDDGWITGHAADEGISVGILEEMVDRIRQGGYVNIHGVLLVRNGKLVFEEYFDGWTVSGRPKIYQHETRHEQHSVTKSVTSLLAGIALDRGLFESLDTPIHTFFPDHPGFEDERKRRILLRHVLSMTAGLAWDEAT